MNGNSGFSVPMALLDFIPVALFFFGSLRIGKDLSKRMNTADKLVYYWGFLYITGAGTTKALHKLIYAVSGKNIVWMKGQFFVNQSLGFLLMGIALLYSLRLTSKSAAADGQESEESGKEYVIIPNGALVCMIIVGMCAVYSSLCKYASKLKCTKAIVMLVISFFLYLGMGYLSSKDFDSAKMNWIAQCLNTSAQALYLLGALMLHEAGLGKLKNE